MFIVKAEVRSDVSPTRFQMFEAESVQVGAPGPRPHSERSIPHVEVTLCDVDGQCKKTLLIGYGLEDYCAVFVMNEKGKTVESIYPPPQAQEASSRPVTMERGERLHY